METPVVASDCAICVDAPPNVTLEHKQLNLGPVQRYVFTHIANEYSKDELAQSRQCLAQVVEAANRLGRIYDYTC